VKKILKDNILNIEGTDTFDNTFLFEYLSHIQASTDREVIYLRDILENKKNEDILTRVKEKPAMYSEVYSPKDELEIFTHLFEEAIFENKKVHIVGVTL